MTRSSTTLMISSSSSSSLQVIVPRSCAESARCVGTECRSRAVSTLLQLLQSVSSTSGSWWSRDARLTTRRNGADVSATLPAHLSITSFPVAACVQCACRRKSGTCRKVGRPSLSSSLNWSCTSRSSDVCLSWTFQQQQQNSTLLARIMHHAPCTMYAFSWAATYIAEHRLCSLKRCPVPLGYRNGDRFAVLDWGKERHGRDWEEAGKREEL